LRVALAEEGEYVRRGREREHNEVVLAGELLLPVFEERHDLEDRRGPNTAPKCPAGPIISWRMW
jgi:hypothetical protein